MLQLQKEKLKSILKKTFKEWINIFKNTDCCATPILDFKETTLINKSKQETIDKDTNQQFFQAPIKQI